MQSAETILGIIRDRGKWGLPLKRVYPLLYTPNLYLRAYARLYANQGAMTPGTTPETVDGMSRAKIDRLIDDLRHERLRWTPVRRVHIPKKHGKRRPLGLPMCSAYCPSYQWALGMAVVCLWWGSRRRRRLPQ